MLGDPLVEVNNRRIQTKMKKEGERNWEERGSEEEEVECLRLPTPKGNPSKEWRRRNKGILFLSSESSSCSRHREIPTN